MTYIEGNPVTIVHPSNVAALADLPPPPIGDNVTKNANAALRALIEHVERLVEEKKAIRDGIRAVYSGAKAGGYDVRALRKIVSLRSMKEGDRKERDVILDTYKHAMGMLV